MNEKLRIWKLFGIFILLAIALSGFVSFASAEMCYVDSDGGVNFNEIPCAINNTNAADIIFAPTTNQDLIITPFEINTEVDQYQSTAQIVTTRKHPAGANQL